MKTSKNTISLVRLFVTATQTNFQNTKASLAFLISAPIVGTVILIVIIGSIFYCVKKRKKADYIPLPTYIVNEEPRLNLKGLFFFFYK